MNKHLTVISGFKKEVVIAGKIITVRDEQIILDVHLAELYEVETRVLKQAVRRNMDRFPVDFMFELTDDEIDAMVSQNVIPSKKHFGGAIPFAFTVNGVAMLSSVLKSKKSIEVNIAIMRTFTLLHRMMQIDTGVVQELEQVKRAIVEQGSNIQLIFDYLDEFEKSKQEELAFKKRPKIGYKHFGE